MQDFRKAEHRVLVLWGTEEERRQIFKLCWLLVVSTALYAAEKQMDPALPACDLISYVPMFRENWSDFLVFDAFEWKIYPCVSGIRRILDSHTEVMYLAGAPKRMRPLRTGRWFKKGIPNTKSYPLKDNSSGVWRARRYLDTCEKLSFRKN